MIFVSVLTSLIVMCPHLSGVDRGRLGEHLGP